jgi:hypothetical protein
MGLEWVLLSFLVAVTLWLGTDACRAGKRLDARLSRVALQRPAAAELSGSADWAYRALLVNAEDRDQG